MQQKLYAFWEYDLCPYMLGGVVKEFTLSGKVRVKGYDGMAFKPIAILPEKSGRDALETLKELRYVYADAEIALKKIYSKKARKLVGLE